MVEVERDMTPKLLKDLGMRYPTEKSIRKFRYGLFECQYCGEEWETTIYTIKRGTVKSCGCRTGGKKTHNLSRHPMYSVWTGMLNRCNNTTTDNYKHYGARGITLCEEWLNPKNFIEWAESTHPNIKDYTLDRIDNDKGYSPENCRWVDKTTQCVNQRMKKNNTSGYVGICYYPMYGTWGASIQMNKQKTHLGTFKTKEEAVQARDQYIIDNGLPHKLSTDYNKETK